MHRIELSAVEENRSLPGKRCLRSSGRKRGGQDDFDAYDMRRSEADGREDTLRRH